jgi:PAS domain S-box-containing protein
VFPTSPRATILNVDDAEGARYARSRLLRNAGFETIEAATGREALEIASSRPIDVVLLDIRLPDVSGYEVCRQLKQSTTTRTIPVLHVTASAQDVESHVRGLQHADAYLTEPVEPAILIATINAMLRARRVQEERATALEQLLQESELIHVSHDAIIIRDAQDRIVKWNAGATELYRWRDSHAIGLTIKDVLRTQVPEGGEDFSGELQRSGRWQGELVHRRRDGAAVIVDSRQVVLQDGNGEPAAVLQIDRDVTAQRRAEAALLERSQHLSMALRSAGMVAWTWNPADGRVTAEENLQDVYGVSSIATVAELSALIHPEDRERHRNELDTVSKQGGKYQARFRIIRPGSASPTWLEEQALAIRDPETGRIRTVVGVSMDITERVRNEQLQAEELDRSKDELRALTASLLHAQEDERRRIARELHDDFGQRLALVNMHVDQLRRDLPAESANLSARLELVASHLTTLCHDARRLSHQLHPSVIEDLGLEVALRQLIEQLERTHGLTARVSSNLSESVLPLELSAPL